MTTALVEALYLKLFEIQCFPAFSISSCWYYYFTILYTLWEWLYLSKKKPAVYSRTTDFLYYSFYLLRCVSDKFSIFKHNLFYFLICLKSFVTNKAFKRFSILWMSVWWCKLHQMPHTPADNITIALQVSVLSLICTDYLCDGLRHRRFLGNY